MVKGYTIKEFCKEDRPREKLKKYGAFSLSDKEVLAILLRTGTKNKNVIDLIKTIFETNNLYCRDICDNEMYNTFRNENIVSADIAHNSISLPIYTHMNLKDLSKSIDEFNEKFENCK